MPAAYSINDGDVIEVRYLMDLQSQRLMNVFHYALSAGAGPIANGPEFIQDVADTFATAGAGTILTKYLACVSNELTFVQCEAQKISPQRWAKKLIAMGDPGAYASTSAPSNLAADITKRTELARGHAGIHAGGVGTLHVPGVPLDAIVGNQLTDDYLTTKLQPLGDRLTLSVTVDAQVLLPVIWHRQVPPTANYDFIISNTAEKYVRTMRRRGALLGI